MAASADIPGPLGVDEVFCIPDDLDDNECIPDWRLLRDHFHAQGRLESECASRIVQRARAIFAAEPNTLKLDASITLVGDVHGQYADMMHMMDLAGDPSETRYLFLGDYVDRSKWGTEIVLLLFALKITFPDRFYLIRGNHESRLMTQMHDFKREVEAKYSADMYEQVMDAFDALPIAALIEAHGRRFFCVHGGLGPEIVNVEDVDNIDRFQEVPTVGPFCDLLWADPIGDEMVVGRSADDPWLKEWLDVRFDFNEERGCSKYFGYKAIVEFAERNNIDSIIRAHDVQIDGYRQLWLLHNDRKFPYVITVFSAPRYAARYNNKAAFLQVLSKMEDVHLNFIQYDAAEHSQKKRPAVQTQTISSPRPMSVSAPTSPSMRHRAQSTSAIPPKPRLTSSDDSAAPRAKIVREAPERSHSETIVPFEAHLSMSVRERTNKLRESYSSRRHNRVVSASRAALEDSGIVARRIKMLFEAAFGKNATEYGRQKLFDQQNEGVPGVHKVNPITVKGK